MEHLVLGLFYGLEATAWSVCVVVKSGQIYQPALGYCILRGRFSNRGRALILYIEGAGWE